MPYDLQNRREKGGIRNIGVEGRRSGNEAFDRGHNGTFLGKREQR